MDEISTEAQLAEVITQLESQMRAAAKNFEFERAAALRDKIRAFRQRDLGVISSTEAPVAPGAPDSAELATAEKVIPAASPPAVESRPRTAKRRAR